MSEAKFGAACPGITAVEAEAVLRDLILRGAGAFVVEVEASAGDVGAGGVEESRVSI